MKKKNYVGIISVFGLFAILSLACATAKNTGKFPSSYEEIVEVSGKKDDIYTKANLVFVDLFNRADSVIQFSDKQAGVIKGRYVTPDLSVKGGNRYKVYTTVQVDVKDGHYRLRMNIAEVIQTGTLFGSSMETTAIASDDILEAMNIEWTNLAASFKKKVSSNSEW